MSETWSSALLDCGASKIVCDKEWLNQYISNLSTNEQNNVTSTKSNHVYRFGDSRKITTIENVTFPANIGGENINIQADILNSDIPLLFSRSSMKKAKMKINFQNDTINAFGQNIPLVTTSRGHFAIPLTPAKQAINDLERESSSNIKLTINNINQQSNHAIALKLHCQFTHPTSDKLI